MRHALTLVHTVAEQPVTDPAVPRLELAEWHAAYGLVAGVTARAGAFDLGLFTNAPAAEVLARWLALRRSLAPAIPGLAISRQVHGAAIYAHDQARAGLLLIDGFDGQVAGCPGLALAITVADCVPVYLAHPASGAVALLHAGWRGTGGGVLEAGIRKLARHASCSLDDIVMHCGVGICGDCYEVGPEVVEAVTGRRPAGPEHLDLRANLAERARRLGVATITLSPWCTAHDPEFFFSHRRSGGVDGRMAAYLGRPADTFREDAS